MASKDLADGERAELVALRREVGQLRTALDRAGGAEPTLTRREHERLLNTELQHQTRNLLTVIRSVFGRTVATGGDLEEVADHFRGRLDSLARTQIAVAQAAGGLVDLENLIRDELLSVGMGDGPGLSIAGPEIGLPVDAAPMVGLALHELTTNSIKFGALRYDPAILDISWSDNINCRGEVQLHLKWTEQGVPLISLPPVRQGFGRELIEEALPYRLGAETSLEMQPGGLCCVIRLPLSGPGAGTAPT